MKSIGVIGNGYVGGAVAAFFQGQGLETKIFDSNPKKSFCSFETVANSPLVFVCTPTPTDISGQNRTSVVTTLKALQGYSCKVVLKSTVLPGTSRFLATSYDRQDLVFSPEFLKARSAHWDFAHPASIVLGTETRTCPGIENFFRLFWPDVPILHTSWEEAEMIKYSRNTFYATKVAWWNELYLLCQKLGVDFEAIKKGVLMGGVIHPSHCDVPRPDGGFGFGGTCLPKDSEALVHFADGRGVNLSVLKQALKSNHQIRGTFIEV